MAGNLYEALQKAEALERAGQDDAAAALYGSILEQLPAAMPSPVLAEFLRRLTALLRRRDREAEAGETLARLMAKGRIWPVRPPEPGRDRILLLYGVDSREFLRIEAVEPELAVSINAGHFDATVLLRAGGFGVDRCFLSSAMTAEDDTRLYERMADYALVVNAIADPAAEAANLRRAALLVEAARRPVLNPPRAVLRTARDEVARRLAGIPGVLVPRIERLAADEGSLLHRLGEAPDGLILRPVHSQTGVGMVRVGSETDLKAALPAFRGREVYAIDYHDFRAADGLYVKMRLFRIGERLLPEHRIAADVWNIHSADRYRLMQGDERLCAAEREFLADPAAVIGPGALEALDSATARFGLDYVGIDFARLPDGRLLVFEANPAMRVNYDHLAAFPYLRPHLDAIADAFAGLVGARLAAPA